ncbi:hypothetical protein [Marinilabilia sp.]|uniref:toxin-antitoxin system YwqK family antitoxin n=1 Tax=Marinilabilia sp. TaxID=2021252 RepID=UPI0025BD6664|nr:hypothetical protein [Marinilabilia sp.]
MIRNIISLTILISFIASCSMVLNKTKEYKELYSNGELKTVGTLKKNKKTGCWLYYNSNGVKIREENYIDDKLTGEAYSWYENGQIQTFEKYHEGMLVDTFKVWNKNGKMSSLIVRGDNGVENGVSKSWYPNGILMQKGYFHNGLLDSVWEEYHDNGQLSSIKHYNKGDKVGKWIYLQENGDTLKTEEYKD